MQLWILETFLNDENLTSGKSPRGILKILGRYKSEVPLVASQLTEFNTVRCFKFLLQDHNPFWIPEPKQPTWDQG